MKPRVRRAGRPRGRLNISWNLWLLIIQPKHALERFLEFNTLFLAFAIVALGGLIQGTTLAMGMDSTLPIVLRVLGRRSPEPIIIVLLVFTFFLSLWLIISLLHTGFGRLVGLAVSAPRLTTALGFAHLPWLLGALFLPLALVESTPTLAAVDSIAKLVSGLWAAFLHVIALKIGLDADHKRMAAVLLLTIYTMLFAIQTIAVLIAIRFGRHLLMNLLVE